MKAAADELDFERAARLRDDLGALERALEKQAVVLGDGTDADVVALAEDELEAAVQVFHVRGGRVRGQRGWVVEQVEDAEPPPSWSSTSCSSVYGGEAGDAVPARGPGARRCPPTPTPSSRWLGEPARQPGRPAGAAARRQAGPAWRPSPATPSRRWCCTRPRAASDLTTRSQALEEIQEALGLDEAPLRIECYDISHLQGTEVVASMVVFEDGLARKSEYRRFVDPAASRRASDDVAVHARGASPGGSGGYLDEQAELGARSTRPTTGADAGRPRDRPARASSPTRPDLVVVDGGPPQVAAAQRGARRARHRRRRRCRPGQAARGGLAARRGRPGDPAAHQRGPLPAAAGPRRGAPVRDHLPPAAALQGDGRRACSTTSPGWARCGARRCSSTSARCKRLRAATVEEIADGARHRARARPRDHGGASGSTAGTTPAVNTATGEIVDDDGPAVRRAGRDRRRPRRRPADAGPSSSSSPA